MSLKPDEYPASYPPILSTEASLTDQVRQVNSVSLRPSYYGDGTQPCDEDLYEVWKVLDAGGISDFYLGNVIKYIARAGRKNPLEQDLSKALEYLKAKVERVRREKK